uniref:Uncharacterized protein n=2 Tax=Setaria viridis TaxID=4556 RepID=A0A4U6T3K6_SETVI|nr:hypothetical protein SEVIR_9G376400v2 [Setaria viridis]
MGCSSRYRTAAASSTTAPSQLAQLYCYFGMQPNGWAAQAAQLQQQPLNELQQSVIMGPVNFFYECRQYGGCARRTGCSRRRTAKEYANRANFFDEWYSGNFFSCTALDLKKE